MTPRIRTVEQMTIEKINANRVAAGRCRHCGGPVPCWSPHGDQRVGVRHSDRSLAFLQRRNDQ